MRMILRPVALVLGAIGVAAATTPGLLRSTTHLASQPFPDALLTVARLGLVLACAWLLLVVLLDLAGRRSRRLALHLTPRWAQGAVLASVGTLATVVPAHADRASLDGLPLPDRPSVGIVEPHAARSTPRPSGDARVTVRAGDTLWAIATRALGPGADAASVARSVHRWHEANRATIGPDPDHIVPGQVLTSPRGEPS